MDVAKWLEDLGVGQYVGTLSGRVNNLENVLQLNALTLDLLGVSKEDVTVILEGVEKLKKSGDTDENIIKDLPSILAIPLKEYFEETNPVLKLWHACDVIELSLRFIVMAGLVDFENSGGIPEKVLKEMHSRIEQPTLGKWEGMALAIAREMPESGVLLPELKTLARDVIAPLLDGPKKRKERNPENSLSALRNQLAHGGGITKEMGAKLLTIWAPKFEKTIKQFSWMSKISIVVKNKDGKYGALQGASIDPVPFEPAPPLMHKLIEGMFTNNDEVLLIRDEKALRLWPLALYGLPETPDSEAKPLRAAPQIYVRRETVCLSFTPVGSDEVCQSQADENALNAFLQFFRFAEFDNEEKKKKFEVRDFEKEIQKDANELVGRAEELETIRKTLMTTEEGVLWLTGSAGIGKSFMVAKITSELMEDASTPDTIVLPFRFKGGDERCSRESFLRFAIERLKSKTTVTVPENGKKQNIKPLAQLKKLLSSLGATRVILILDGLDELAEHDSSFVEEVPMAMQYSGVTWLCAGRSEGGLGEAFNRDRCKHVFPNKVPPMDKGDIRTMLLEKIGHLRKRLIQNDHEEKDSTGKEIVVNDFVERVAAKAEGFPIYVKYVVGDVLSGKLGSLDAREGANLPPSLESYHEKLLERCKVGELQLVLTPLAATIAVSKEPLSVLALTDILRNWGMVTGDSIETMAGIITRGLSAISSMLRRASTPEGVDGYTLFHHSLRQHMGKSRQMEGPLALARQNICEMSARKSQASHPNSAPYIFHWGLSFLLEDGRLQEVSDLLSDIGYVADRLEATSGRPVEVFALINDYIRFCSKDPDDSRAAALLSFVDRHSHILKNAPDSVLSVAANQPSDEELSTCVRPILRQRGAQWLEWINKPSIRDHFLRTLSGQASAVNCCAFSPDGASVVSGAANGSIRVWESNTGKEITTLPEFRAPVTGCEFSPDGRRLITNTDSEVKVWSTEHWKELSGISIKFLTNEIFEWGECNGQRILFPTSHYSPGSLSLGSDVQFDFSHDGKRFLFAHKGNLWTWETESGNIAKSFALPNGMIEKCRFSQDGQYILLLTNRGTIATWESETGSLIRTTGGDSEFFSDFSSNSEGNLITFAQTGLVTVWNLKTGESGRTFSIGQQVGDAIPSFSRDGRHLFCHDVSKGGREIETIIIDVESGEPVCSIPDNAKTISISPSADYFAYSSDDTIFVRKKGGDSPQCYSGHYDTVTALRFSEDQRYLLSASCDETLKIWPAYPSKESKGRSITLDFTVSGDGRYTAALHHGGIFQIFDAMTESIICSIDNVNRFVPFGKGVAIFQNNGLSGIIDYKSGRRTHTFMEGARPGLIESGIEILGPGDDLANYPFHSHTTTGEELTTRDNSSKCLISPSANDILRLIDRKTITGFDSDTELELYNRFFWEGDLFSRYSKPPDFREVILHEKEKGGNFNPPVSRAEDETQSTAPVHFAPSLTDDEPAEELPVVVIPDKGATFTPPPFAAEKQEVGLFQSDINRILDTAEEILGDAKEKGELKTAPPCRMTAIYSQDDYSVMEMCNFGINQIIDPENRVLMPRITLYDPEAYDFSKCFSCTKNYFDDRYYQASNFMRDDSGDHFSTPVLSNQIARLLSDISLEKDSNEDYDEDSSFTNYIFDILKHADSPPTNNARIRSSKLSDKDWELIDSYARSIVPNNSDQEESGKIFFYKRASGRRLVACDIQAPEEDNLPLEDTGEITKLISSLSWDIRLKSSDPQKEVCWPDVECVDISPFGRYVIIFCKNGDLHAINTSPPNSQFLARDVDSYRLSPCGGFVSTVHTDGRVKLFNLIDSTEIPLPALIGKDEIDWNLPQSIGALPLGMGFCFLLKNGDLYIRRTDIDTAITLSFDAKDYFSSPCGQYLFVIAPDSFLTCRTDDGSVVSTINTDSNKIRDVYFLGTWNRVAVSRTNGILEIWDTESGEEIDVLHGVSKIDHSGGACVAERAKSFLIKHDSCTGEIKCVIPASGSIEDFKISMDGRHACLIGGWGDYNFLCYCLRTGQLSVKFEEYAPGQYELGQSNHWLLLKNESVLLTAGYDKITLLTLVNSNESTMKAPQEAYALYLCEAAPNHDSIATLWSYDRKCLSPFNDYYLISEMTGRWKTGSMVVWSTDPPEEKLAMQDIASCCYSPDSKFLAVASGSRIFFFSTSTWESVSALESPTAGNPTNLQYSPDGQWLVSLHEGGEIVIWDHRNEKAVSTFRNTPVESFIPVTPAENLFITGMDKLGNLLFLGMRTDARQKNMDRAYEHGI